VVAQREQRVGQLKANSTLKDSGLVVSNSTTKFQVLGEDRWIAIEVTDWIVPLRIRSR
jgi:hypothetical protein